LQRCWDANEAARPTAGDIIEVLKQKESPIFQRRDLTVVKSFLTSFRPIDIGKFIPCGDGLNEESQTALASTIECLQGFSLDVNESKIANYIKRDKHD
jgi:hypothetical protein